MEESSTPNPFEREPSGESRESWPEPEQSIPDATPGESPNPGGKLKPILPDEEEAKPQKLKLKQILTPLSPHLTAPRPQVDERIAAKKSFNPSPKAVPVEPEPELTEEELAAREMAGGPKAEGASPEIETSPPTTEELGEEPAEEKADGAGGEEELEPTAKKATKKTAQAVQPKARKLVLTLSVPVVLLFAIAFLVHFLFDPLGFKIEPIEELPDLTPLQRTAEAHSGNPVDSDSSHLISALEEETVSAYISRLEDKAVIVPAGPQGMFIDAVYFREGMVVNPRYGLALVSIDEQGRTALLEDREGTSYRIGMR